MTSRSTVIRNFAALLCSEFIVRAAASLAALLIARSLGPKQYGILAVALSTSFIAGYLCDLGMTHLTLQKSAIPGIDLCVLLSTMLRARLVLTTVVTMAGLVWILLGYTEYESRLIMLLVILPSTWGISLGGFGASCFWLKEEMHISSAIKTGGQVLMALALFLSFLLKLPVLWVAASYGTVSLLGGLVTMWIFRLRVGRVSGWDPILLRGLAGFTLGGFAGMALPQVGPILLQRVTSGVQLGYFAAASRIPLALCAIPGSVALAWYPQLFHLANRNRAQHIEKCAQEIKIILVLGLGLALPLFLYPALIIRVVLGRDWVAVAGPVLSTLCWMAVLNSIAGPLGDALATQCLQMRKAAVYCIALLIGATLYFWLGRASGAMGGARAAVITMVALCAGLVFVNPTGLQLVATSLKKSLRSVVTATAACICVRLVLPTNLLSSVSAFIAFFTVVGITDKELRGGALWAIGRLRLKWESA